MADETDLSDLGAVAAPGREMQPQNLSDLGTLNQPTPVAQPKVLARKATPDPTDLSDLGTLSPVPQATLPGPVARSTPADTQSLAAPPLPEGAENPWTIKGMTRASARVMGNMARQAQAVVGDAARAMNREKPENIQTLTGDYSHPLPIETELQQGALESKQRGETPWRAALAGASTGLTKTVPKFALLGLAPETLLAQSVAAGGLFGLDDEGNFQPKQAVIAALLPGVGSAGRWAVSQAIGKTLAAGGNAPINATAQKILETLGEQVTLNSYMAATQAPELMAQLKEDPSGFALHLGEIIGTNLGFALLGAGRFRKDVPSGTKEWVQKNADTLATRKVIESFTPDELRGAYQRVTSNDPATTQADRDIVTMINQQIGKPAAAIKSGVNIVEQGWPEKLAQMLGIKGGRKRLVEVMPEGQAQQPVPPEQQTGQPAQQTQGPTRLLTTGEPNADSVKSPVAQVRNEPSGPAPQVPGGESGIVPQPAGAAGTGAQGTPPVIPPTVPPEAPKQPTDLSDLGTPVAPPKKAEAPKSSTQLTLPPQAAKPVTDFAQSIPDSEVYHKADEAGNEDYGIETEPHITALFGLTKHAPDPVAKAIAGHGPITVTLGKMSVFKNDDYDVLKVDVDSPELHALRKKLEKLPNEQTFKDFQPHMTIAYLKKGEGQKYVGNPAFEGQKLTFNTLTFSPPKELRATIGRPELPLHPALPPNHIDVTIQRADGSTYPAAFGGYWEQLPGTPPVISRVKDGAWSTGSLDAGEKIVSQVPAPPEQKPMPPQQVIDDGQILQLLDSRANAQSKAITMRKMAEQYGLTLKVVQEIVEARLVQIAHLIFRKPDISPDEKFKWAIEAYNRQPMLTARTSSSVEGQKYSTPIPLSYAMSYAMGTTPQTSVYDATGGNGMLLVGGNLSASQGNELDQQRATAMKALGVGAVTSNDATTYTPATKFPVVMLNPPFGSIPNVNYGGFGIKKLEHIISLRALEAMEDNGAATLILGAKREEGESGHGAQWVFENYLYGHYNVIDNFEVSGDLYGRQGAKWPVRVIVIHGRRSNPEVADLAPKSVARLNTWGEVWARAQSDHDEIAARREALGAGDTSGISLPVKGQPPAKPGTVLSGPGTPTSKAGKGGKSGRSGSGKQPVEGQPPVGISDLATNESSGGPPWAPTTTAQPGGNGNETTGVEGGGGTGAVPTTNAPGGSAAGGAGSQPGNIPGKTGVNRPAGDLTGLTDAELDAMLAAADEATNEPAPAPAPKPAPPRAPRPPGAPGPRTSSRPPEGPPKPAPAPKIKSAAEMAADMAKEGVSGMGDVMKGLTELLGGGELMGSGPAFNEKTYEKAKPFFKAGYEKFTRAGKTLMEFFQSMFEQLKETAKKFEGIARENFERAIKGLLKRFIQDMQLEKTTPPPPKPKKDSPPKVEGNELQAPYDPVSEGEPFGALTPSNIATAEREALDRLAERVGPLTEFVANRLNMSVEEVRDALSSEQIDGDALMLDAIENGGSVIVGDQTGIGKGRQAAALIRYAILHGKIPIFFTADPKLFSDMWGDLQDVYGGGADMQKEIAPLILGDPKKASIVGADGQGLVKSPGKAQQNREMQRILQSSLTDAGYRSVFVTYSQINERNARQQFLEQLAHDNPAIVILDESHLSAGDAKASMSAAFMSGGTVIRGSGADIEQISVPGLLNAPGTQQAMAGGVAYLSATYAKRPDNMPVYFRTDLHKAAQSFTDIVNAMKRGGVAMQQAVSEALAKAGQYLRRERSFDGVRYDTVVLSPKDPEQLVADVDEVTNVLSEIVRFSKMIRDRVEGATAQSENHIAMTDFASIVHNQLGQLLLAAKADEVINAAVAAKERGEKPVIALTNTMESFLDNYTDDMAIKSGQPITLRWNELLKYALSRTLRVSEEQPNGDTVISSIDPDEFGLGDFYRQIEALADALPSKFPITPIDYILQRLDKAGVTMGELTARTSGIEYTDFENGHGIYRKFKQANKNAVINRFNEGGTDGMLLNTGTGFSAHASVKVKDKRPRHMFIVQPAPDINNFMQILGRIFRTGMVSEGKYYKAEYPQGYYGSNENLKGTQQMGGPPYYGQDITTTPYGARYSHFTLPLQAEIRPAAMAMKKMKSLNANTTSNSENAVKIASEDILNKYGDQIVAEFLDENHGLQWQTGIHISQKDDGSVEVPQDVARKFTGRMALLPDAQQKEIYDTILPAYKQLIDQLKSTGAYDLEISVHDDWDGQQVSNEQLSAGTDESSIFTAGLKLQRWQVKDNRKVPTGREMLDDFHKRSGSPEKVRADWKAYQGKVDTYIAVNTEKAQNELAAANAKVQAGGTASDAMAASQAQARLTALSMMNGRWQTTQHAVDDLMRELGQVVILHNKDSEEIWDAIMTEIKIPTRLTAAPSAFRLRYAVNAPGGVQFLNVGNIIADKWSTESNDKELEDLTASRTGNRYERHFIVGNPIGAITATGGKGKLVRFKAQDGAIITGLMMANNWGPHKLVNDPRLDLQSGAASTHFLMNNRIPVEAGGVVRVEQDRRSDGEFAISTSASRKTGGPIFLDPAMRRLTGDFVKTGQRMVANVEQRDLPAATKRLMEITNAKFRPVGKDRTMFQSMVARSNEATGGARAAFGEDAGTVVGPERPVVETRTVEELRAAINHPDSGLPPQAVKLMNAFLDSPLADTLEGVRVQLRDTLSNGWQGSYFQQLAQIARTADPKAGIHEFAHRVWEVLPDDIKAEMGRLRGESLSVLIKEATEKGDQSLVAALTDLRDNPAKDTEDFLSRAIPKGSRKLLYHHSSDEEYFTHSFSDRFEQKAGSVVDGFWARVKEIWAQFVSALKKALKLRRNQTEWLDDIIAGRFDTTPESGSAYDHDRMMGALPPEEVQAAEAVKDSAGVTLTDMEGPEAAAKAMEEGRGEPAGGIPTKIFNSRDFVLDRPRMSPEVVQAGIEYTGKFLTDLGFQVEKDASGRWRLIDEDWKSEAEGQKLVKALEEALRTQSVDAASKGYLANLLDSIVLNFTPDRVTAFSPTVKDQLYALAQGERSFRGLMLGMHSHLANTVNYVARNAQVILRRVWGDSYGGPQVEKVLRRVLTEFRSRFGDQEIEDALKDHPGTEQLIRKLIALNARDTGGRLYRKLQNLFKPKSKKALAALENDARINEIASHFIQEMQKQGVKPVPNPNKALSPLHQLALMVKPETAAKLDAMMSQALAEAEHNAGVAAWRKQAVADDDVEDVEARIAVGEEPSQELIDAGLKLPEWAHWGKWRDKIVGYSPITMKLVEKVLKGDFQGMRFGDAKGPKPVDTRIDINKLATEPDAEVQRVMDAYLANIESIVNVDDNPQVMTMIEDEVVRQLAAARKRVADIMFAAPKDPASRLTPDQQMAKLVNAKLFADPRLNLAEMVARLATKSQVTKLMPKIGDLVKQVIENSRGRQDRMAEQFADLLANRYGLTDEQRETAKLTFGQAFNAKMGEARVKALAATEKALTPQQRRELKPGKPQWKKIIEAVHAGVFDSGEVMRRIATAFGVRFEEADFSKLHDLADRIDKMMELPADERGLTGNARKMAQEAQLATSEHIRLKLKKEIETIWARATRPITIKTAAGRAEIVRAAGELATANLLFKGTFATKQLIDVITQGATHNPTRAVSKAIDRWLKHRDDTTLWKELSRALSSSYWSRSKAFKTAWAQFGHTLVGRNDVKNVERLISGVAAFDRMLLTAEELDAKGQHAQAGMLKLVALLRYSFRMASAADNLQGVPLEYQEIHDQVIGHLRDQGLDAVEARKQADQVVGEPSTEYLSAKAEAEMRLASGGEPFTDKDVNLAARNLVLQRAYQRMAEIGMDADSFQERNQFTRSVAAWNEREHGGPGAIVAEPLRQMGRLAPKVGLLGLPLVAASRFSNAIHIGTNRAATWAGLGLFPGLFEGSNLYKTAEDRRQRQVEGAAGLSVQALMALLAALGVIVVRSKWPKDKEEQQLWEKNGWKPGTVEIPLPGGNSMVWSTTTGPFMLARPGLAMGGAIKSLLDDRAKAQAKMDTEAAKRGLVPGKIAPISMGDWLGVATDAALNAITGGRTASGFLSSFTSYGKPNISRGAAAVTSSFAPYLPEFQELMRMAGQRIDAGASALDFLVGLPVTSAAKVNFMGDSVATEDRVNDVISRLTGGTSLPGSKTPAAAKDPAYAALIESGYRPPSIAPGKGYAINGEFRPLDAKELAQYAQLRGQYFKQELQESGYATDEVTQKADYARANQRALEEVGVTTASAGVGGGAASISTRSAAAAPASAGATTTLTSRGAAVGAAAVAGGRGSGSSRSRGARVGSRRGLSPSMAGRSRTTGLGAGRGISSGRRGVRRSSRR